MAFNGIITTDSSMQIKLVSAYNDQVGYTLTIADLIARVKQIYRYETISMIKFDQAFGGNDGYRAQVVFNTCEILRIVNDTSLMNSYSESGNMYFITENTDILDYNYYNYFIATSTHNDIVYSAQGAFASSPSFTLPDGLSYRATGGGGNPTTIIYYDPACFTSVYINGTSPVTYTLLSNYAQIGASSCPDDQSYYSGNGGQKYVVPAIFAPYYNLGVWAKDASVGDEITIAETSEGRVYIRRDSYVRTWQVKVAYTGGATITLFDTQYNVDDNLNYQFLIFGIDEENQYASITLVRQWNASSIYINCLGTDSQRDIYPIIYGGITPTYNWSSVSAISGKNGTLNLTEILNINDGDPVNDVPYTDNVDFTAVSKVNNMVAAVVQDSNAVIVEYTVPEDTYEYVKLVYKKDNIPEFVSDGTATNISQGSGEKAILGIADGGTYWFVIFTDKSTSEPVEFRTSATGWDGSEVILMWSGENNKLTAQVSEGHILFKMYSESNVIYSFTAESGATVADSYNIYVQFLEDENQQIAKPSFVYYGAGTGYTINQEIPTDEEMADIYSWLHPSS